MSFSIIYESNIPDWENNNHYVRYSLPPHIGRLLCLYGSRQEMISFIEACRTGRRTAAESMDKGLQAFSQTSPSYQPAEMIHREKNFLPVLYGLPIPETLLLIRADSSGSQPWKRNSHLDIEITCAPSEEFWRTPDHCLPDSGEACLVPGSSEPLSFRQHSSV